MKTQQLLLQPKHKGNIIDEVLKLKTLIEYHKLNIIPYYPQMEKWEVKEYESVLNKWINQFFNYKKFIIEHESVFNQILSDYNLTVSVFINKYLLSN